MTIGEQLVAARKARGLTQQQVALQLHVTRQTISSWEVGRSYPDMASVITLATYFALSLDQLLKGDAEMLIDAKQKEQERRNAKLMYYGALVVDIGGWLLILAHRFNLVGFEIARPAALIVVGLLVVNTLVLAAATGHYQRQVDRDPSQRLVTCLLLGLAWVMVAALFTDTFLAALLWGGASTVLSVGGWWLIRR